MILPASPMGKLRCRFLARGHKATMSRQGDEARAGHGPGSCGEAEIRLQLLTTLRSGLTVLTCKVEGRTLPRGCLDEGDQPRAPGCPTRTLGFLSGWPAGPLLVLSGEACAA